MISVKQVHKTVFTSRDHLHSVVLPGGNNRRPTLNTLLYSKVRLFAGAHSVQWCCRKGECFKENLSEGAVQSPVGKVGVKREGFEKEMCTKHHAP